MFGDSFQNLCVGCFRTHVSESINGLGLQSGERHLLYNLSFDDSSFRRQRLIDEAAQAVLSVRAAHLAYNRKYEQGATVVSILGCESLFAEGCGYVFIIAR